jgi:hypothetical protein
MDYETFMNELDELLAKPLTTADEAEAWVHAMHKIGYGCHPDDSAETIVESDTGEPSFTEEQCPLYDARMGEAFDLLPDVYETSLEALRAVR